MLNVSEAFLERTPPQCNLAVVVSDLLNVFLMKYTTVQAWYCECDRLFMVNGIVKHTETVDRVTIYFTWQLRQSSELALLLRKKEGYISAPDDGATP